MEINKKFLSNSLKIALLILIFYYPYQIVKYYLTDFTYADIVDYEWRMDNICSLSPCPEGLTSFEGECSIKHDGYLYYNKTPIGKVIEMKKPNYFTSGEIITGGSLKIQNLISGKICKYDSVI